MKVAVQATDATRHRGEGLRAQVVQIDFGDGSRTVTGRKAAHRYGHSGKVTVRVSATDKAGNAIVLDAPDHDPQVARRDHRASAAPASSATLPRGPTRHDARVTDDGLRPLADTSTAWSARKVVRALGLRDHDGAAPARGRAR